jgi:cytochrome c biogenesis protein CcmG/thiol:disulfide interchange protein DsbE
MREARSEKRAHGSATQRCIALAALTLCIVSSRAKAQAAPVVGDVAPVVSVADLDGKPVKIVVGSGKRAAVVEFWATWCEICRALLPNMRAAQKAYGDRVDFYGVNVTVNERKERVKQYVAQNRPPFLTLYDERGVAARAFGAVATSYVVIIDQKGKVAYIGDGSDQDIPAALAKLVK